MINQLKLLKNNDNREDSDLEWVNEFYEFLQGSLPETISMESDIPKLNKETAFNIIWYLQEHFPLIPDRIDKCSECDELYDSWAEGYYSEKRGKDYCEGCVPPFIDEEE